jgi:hypothetical protein
VAFSCKPDVTIRSRNSSVSTVTRLRARRPEFDTRQEYDDNFSLRHRVRTGSETHSTSYPMSAGGSYLRVKWPRREADHTPPSNTEVNNVWSYTSAPPIRLHGVVLNYAGSTSLHGTVVG